MIARGCVTTPVPGWRYVNGCWTPPWLLPAPSSHPWWVIAAGYARPIWLAGIAVAVMVAGALAWRARRIP